jgi:hypothetical protein
MGHTIGTARWNAQPNYLAGISWYILATDILRQWLPENRPPVAGRGGGPPGGQRPRGVGTITGRRANPEIVQ